MPWEIKLFKSKKGLFSSGTPTYTTLDGLQQHEDKQPSPVAGERINDTLSIDLSNTDAALIASKSVLGVLATVASFSPIPGLKEVAQLAISVLEKIQASRVNEFELEDAIRRLCTLIISINTLVSPTSGNDVFGDAIKDFTKHLNNIQQICLELVAQPSNMRKVFYADKYTDVMVRIRAEIHFAYEKFSLENTLITQELLSAWRTNNENQLAQIVKKLESLEAPDEVEKIANDLSSNVQIGGENSTHYDQIDHVGDNYSDDVLTKAFPTNANNGTSVVKIGGKGSYHRGRIGQIGNNYGSKTFNSNCGNISGDNNKVFKGSFIQDLRL